eukprot:6927404-Pyramimonas_sp.AAC.1
MSAPVRLFSTVLRTRSRAPIRAIGAILSPSPPVRGSRISRVRVVQFDGLVVLALIATSAGHYVEIVDSMGTPADFTAGVRCVTSKLTRDMLSPTAPRETVLRPVGDLAGVGPGCDAVRTARKTNLKGAFVGKTAGLKAAPKAARAPRAAAGEHMLSFIYDIPSVSPHSQYLNVNIVASARLLRVSSCCCVPQYRVTHGLARAEVGLNGTGLFYLRHEHPRGEGGGHRPGHHELRRRRDGGW